MITSSITGIPGSYVENVQIQDVNFQYKGSGTLDEAGKPVPEKIDSYPENRMFGYSLPAYGLYVRHVKNLSLENFHFQLLSPDARPGIILDDCHDVLLDKFDMDTPEKDQPLIRCIQSTNVTISGYRSPRSIPLFIRVEGEHSANIKLINNDLSLVNQLAEFTAGSRETVLKKSKNLY